MPLPAPKTGPFTIAELIELWKTVTDPLYLQPLIDQGEGQGLEVFTQQMAQLARVSEALDRTLQAMFILPSSGQSDLPGRGPARATVELVAERAHNFTIPISIVPAVAFEEVQTDYGTDGPVEVLTERRYFTQQMVTFAPGESGPKTLTAVAEKDGYGYNNPLPGTINRFVQPGSAFMNSGASVVLGPTLHQLVMAPQPDVLTPDSVGQYIRFVAGSNVGAVRRVVGYVRPNGVHGGIALLAKTAVVRVLPGAGTFSLLEDLTIGATPVEAQFVHQFGDTLVIERVAGVISPGDAIVGAFSGATATVDFVDQDPELVAETATAAWEVLDWVVDLGFSVSNPQSPSGGRAAMLDELGAERGLPRAPGEDDESYRKRIAQLPDVVSPNAIRRVANRVLSPYGAAACLREVGLELFRGLLAEGNPYSTDPAVSFAFDLDHVAFTTGAITGTFVEGEVVHQTTSSGEVAAGRANVRRAGPGQWVFDGVARVKGDFEVGQPVVGQVSGASFTPSAVSGGLRPEDRFKLLLDYVEFRSFFMVGVPPLGLGEFGSAYDVGGSNAYDASPYLAFYDGFAATAAVIYRTIWQAVDKARAAGVGFDLYVENIGCF